MWSQAGVNGHTQSTIVVADISSVHLELPTGGFPRRTRKHGSAEARGHRGVPVLARVSYD